MVLESATVTSLAGPPLERISKPWGEELVLSRTRTSIVKMLRIDPNRRLSLQYHRRKHETLRLLSGQALLTIGPSAKRLRQVTLLTGMRQDIPAGVVHRLSAGDDGANILEVASRPPDDEDDIVRLADDYGRADVCGRA